MVTHQIKIKYYSYHHHHDQDGGSGAGSSSVLNLSEYRTIISILIFIAIIPKLTFATTINDDGTIIMTTTYEQIKPTDAKFNYTNQHENGSRILLNHRLRRFKYDEGGRRRPGDGDLTSNFKRIVVKRDLNRLVFRK